MQQYIPMKCLLHLNSHDTNVRQVFGQKQWEEWGERVAWVTTVHPQGSLNVMICYYCMCKVDCSKLQQAPS